MTTGQIVLVVAVAAALAFGAWRAATDGRFRGTHRVHGAVAPRPAAIQAEQDAERDAETDGRVDVWSLVAPGAGTAGERATLLQFSSAFCAPCRATRRTLGEVASAVPGVNHVEIDAEHHLDLVRELGVLRTPTTLVLDGRGREVRRASGAPRKAEVLAALNEAVS